MNAVLDDMPKALQEAVKKGELKNGATRFTLNYAINKYGLKNVLGCLGNSVGSKKFNIIDLTFLEYEDITEKEFTELMSITDYIANHAHESWILQSMAYILPNTMDAKIPQEDIDRLNKVNKGEFDYMLNIKGDI
jgi:hypothetical protein